MQLNLALSDNAYNSSYCVHLNQTKLRSYLRPRTTDTRRLNLKFFAAKIQMPLPNNYLGVGYKGFGFFRNNGWIMENMDKELTVPKWVLIVWPKIPQMPQKISPKMSAQVQKFKIFEKRLSLGVRSPCLRLCSPPLIWIFAVFHDHLILRDKVKCKNMIKRDIMWLNSN